MNIETKIMGSVFIDDKLRLSFPSGLYGFETQTDFVLLDSECQPFMWLQSLKEKSLAFLVVDPFLFFPEYEIDLDEESLHKIGVSNPSDVHVLVIVTLVQGNVPAATANLQGPLVINKNTKTARQVVSPDPRWITKHNLLGAVKKGKQC